MSQPNGDTRLPVRLAPHHALALGTAGERGLELPVMPVGGPSARLADYVSIFIRRKWSILISLVAILGASLLATAVTPRLYEATSTLLISQPPKDSDQSSNSTAASMAAPGSPNLDTHVQLIEGESTAVQTALWLQKSGGPAVSVQALHKAIDAQAVRDTQLIRINARAGSPDEAQAIANAAANAYVAANRRRARGSSESTARYLSEQLVIARQNLTRAEEAVRRFKESTGTISADASAGDLLSQVATLRSDSDKAAADLAQAKARLSRAQTDLAQQNRSIGTGQTRDDKTIDALKGKLADLQGQRLAAKERYTDAYPGPLRQIDDQIRTVRQQLNTEIRRVVHGGGDLALQQSLTAKVVETQAEVSALTGRLSALRGQLSTAQSGLSKIPSRQLRLADLEQQLQVAQSNYGDLLKKSQEVEVGKVMALGNADVAEPASRPRLPVRPNVPLNLALGLLLGLGVGVGIALVQDQLDDTVRDQTEVSRITAAPVLGAIPAFTAVEERRGLLPLNGAHSTALEAYRALRYCLDFAASGESGRVILVTSAGPSEGKTTTVLNLAMAVALTGRKVILIDTDLRRSGLRRMLEAEEKQGLTDVLLGEAELTDVMRKSDENGLIFISSGKQVPNPMELLDSPRMREVVAQLRQEANLVIFDSPPLLSVADTLVLAGLSDSVLMVCVAGESQRYDIQLARQLLSHVGESIDGVVLNKIGKKAGYGYHNRYYYY